MPFDYNTTRLPVLQQLAVAGDLERLDNEACIQSYGLSDSKESPYGNLLVVTSLELNDSVIAMDYHEAVSDDQHGYWLCDGDGYAAGYLDTDINGDGRLDTNTDRGMMRSSENISCSDTEALLANAETWTIDEQQWFGNRYGTTLEGRPVRVVSAPVSYCLAEPYTPRCAVGLQTTLLTVVIVCNAIKIIAMLVCAFWAFDPLATSGDAIASFLAAPEPHSDRQGPLSIIDLRKSRSTGVWSTSGRMLNEKSLRWRNAASQGSKLFSRWLLSFYT